MKKEHFSSKILNIKVIAKENIQWWERNENFEINICMKLGKINCQHAIYGTVAQKYIIVLM